MAKRPSPAPDDFAGRALDYARRAMADRSNRTFCKWVRLAAKRHIDDLKRAETDDAFPFYFDPEHAADACGFIEELPHVEGDWNSETITLEDAQVFWIACVFGWRRKVDGRRRFTRVYIECARKNAKSTLTAGIALYCAACEGEPAPYIFIGATTGDQARKVFHPAKMMVLKTPDLTEAFGLKAWANAISLPDGGYIRPINAKASTQDGHNPHVGILDELHAHKDRALHDVIRSAFGARKNPLMWVITTAGYNIAGVCYEQRVFVTKVLQGIVEADHYFGIIYTLDEGDDPFAEPNWIKANPLLGVSVQLDEMRSNATEAKASPESEGEFKTKRLNVWLNSASAWLNADRWKACADPGLSWDRFKGLRCYVGADLADRDDITAAGLLGIDEDGRRYWKPVFWLPEAVLHDPEHAEGRGPAPYRTWSEAGHLRLTPGDWVDHNEVEDQIREWIEEFGALRVTFDQFAAAQHMASRLNEDFGNEEDPVAVILHKSARNVTDPARDLEACVKAGPRRFVHDGNPVMSWMASNVTVTRRVDGSIIPKKETAMSAMKIDGIDALVNALAPAVALDEKPPTSVYSERGLLIL